ncbi:MAG: SMP-30/gluconolactonase/LRE family protein [Planctomycetes bacterium]|nr:SMP-30/gluconolactonase/LRE family protein [Planctomycetota bacterium]
MKKAMLVVVFTGFSVVPLWGQDIPLAKILVAREGWHEAAKGVKGITFLDAEPSGDVAIYTGERTHVLRSGDKLEKLRLPPAIIPPKDYQTVKTRAGARYQLDKDRKVVEVSIGKKKVVLKLPGLRAPNCLASWPDEGHLVIGESDGAYLWAVRIEKDGSLGPGDRYYSLRVRKGERLPVTAITMDASYLLYACTPLGVQVFDPTGRLSGVIAMPSKETMTAITIGGAKADTLFVAAGDRIWARRIMGKAAYTIKK